MVATFAAIETMAEVRTPYTVGSANDRTARRAEILISNMKLEVPNE